MKKLAILQSNYIPWKGYFDLIASVDEFIVYDEMQYTKNDWRNRNKIKTPSGLVWLTIPVGIDINQRIIDVKISDNIWRKKHWKSLELNYKKSKFFLDVSEFIEPIYKKEYSSLSQVNVDFIKSICSYLDITTKITSSSSYNLLSGKTERLVGLCEQAGAHTYVSGPAAKDYLDQKLFVERGIEVQWFDYSNYPEYPQLWGGKFEHYVSILDLLFNCGKQSRHFMKY